MVLIMHPLSFFSRYSSMLLMNVLMNCFFSKSVNSHIMYQNPEGIDTHFFRLSIFHKPPGSSRLRLKFLRQARKSCRTDYPNGLTYPDSFDRYACHRNLDGLSSVEASSSHLLDKTRPPAHPACFSCTHGSPLSDHVPNDIFNLAVELIQFLFSLSVHL